MKVLELLSKTDCYNFAVQTLGFDACGFTSPFLDKELDEYRDLVTNGDIGDMGYLLRHLPFKENPNLLLDGVKTAIVVIKNYKNTSEKQAVGERKVARYAAGLDYHQVMSEELLKLEAFIKSKVPDAGCYVGVDSRPIPERSLAIKAGIGFRGRNTMIIRPKMGSYFLIGVILTTAVFEFDLPAKGSCGTCTRCIDACPTQAITPDGTLLPTQCISYQTIEKKTPVEKETLAEFQNWIFGCDVCQEVCPFNHLHTPLTDWTAFLSENGVGFHLPNMLDEQAIPKNSPLYRSRKRITQNLDTLASD